MSDQVNDMVNDMEWIDEEAGPVVRPYAMTGGRTIPSSTAFDLMSMVVATGATPSPRAHLSSEHRRLLGLVGRARPIVEVASDAGLPLGVVKVLLGDLLDHGLILVRQPIPAATSPAQSLLLEVINGIRAL
ncbi:hypothetical protein Ppa06_56000 [Planomonospora parontospora subsp. parontospora]|uniref:DUF742 domain-containing protein n=2 Tax=Planomonospora parontospora TaxID=58119 RepID=A0AA37BJI6_9ACTN|nr:DUF742 domain-containing protein [Planomonospora parontospora]GGK81089.1 hypothetical protein GCM10010126_45540 [Planomonospora parontospora]GII11802.1 hypothetical protein Ppa06_56000 [Planomonospora parontospora subsp. parontospora]